jgi:hypothetical protein
LPCSAPRLPCLSHHPLLNYSLLLVNGHRRERMTPLFVVAASSYATETGKNALITGVSKLLTSTFELHVYPSEGSRLHQKLPSGYSSSVMTGRRLFVTAVCKFLIDIDRLLLGVSESRVALACIPHDTIWLSARPVTHQSISNQNSQKNCRYSSYGKGSIILAFPFP